MLETEVIQRATQTQRIAATSYHVLIKAAESRLAMIIHDNNCLDHAISAQTRYAAKRLKRNPHKLLDDVKPNESTIRQKDSA